MNPMERGNRFSDWTPIQTQGQPVFAGPDAIIARLNDLRTHINNIRTEWHNKDKFKKSLQTRILYDLNLTEEEERLQLRSEIDALFARDLTWIDAGYKYSGSEETDFCGITLYTSSSGYDCVFGHFNKLLRGEEVQNDPELARDTVFLVELLTIELYNFRFANWGNPMIYDFEGIVYRGMSLPEESFRYLQEVANRPANQRTISVPLSFLSATSDKTVAEQFFVGDKAQNERCIQWIIHVRSLAPDLAESFNKQYPESIVTSLCAIPIARLSKFWQEKEVLLRGPFFQVLRMYEDEGLDAAGNSFRFHKLEVVMLNSNRDHQTAEASDIGQDKEMRQHFRKAVEVSRNAICAELAEEQGLHDDAAYFRRVATEGRVELGLSRDSPPASSPGSKPTAWGTEWSAGHASHFFARPYRERRAAYAAIISEQNWGELFKVIDEEYEWQKGDWVNYVDLAGSFPYLTHLYSSYG